MKKIIEFGFLLSLCILMISACGRSASSSMEVENAWVRAAGGTMGSGSGNGNTEHSGMGTEESKPGSESPQMGMNSAAYLIIHNRTGTDDHLLRVKSDVAQAVELHQTQVENEVMTMRPVDGIAIPSGGDAILEPGGYHIMLIGLKQPLEVGQHVQLILFFEKAPSLTIEAEIRAP